MYYPRQNPYYRRNSDAGFRAAERERRYLGFSVGDYIKYLVDEDRDPDSKWEFHDIDHSPRQVTELLDQAFGEESVVSYLPVVHWTDLTHHEDFDGEFNAFTFGDAETTLVWPVTVIRDIEHQGEFAALIRELDSLQLRRVLIGF